MLIDWFTVVAQVVNFLILVALLKHFLYDRIIKAMDAREERVRSRLESAEKREKESEEEAGRYRRRHQEIEEERKAIMDKAREEADRQLKELTRQARQDVEIMRSRWQEAIGREKEAFLRELRQLVKDQVYVLSRQVLRDLADVSLEERLIHVFLDEIEKIGEEERNRMAKAMQGDGNHAIVRSGFEISGTERQKITRVLHDTILKDADIKYETDPEVIAGIELRGRGQKIAWSFDNYLKDLEQKTRVALDRISNIEPTGTEQKAEKSETKA